MSKGRRGRGGFQERSRVVGVRNPDLHFDLWHFLFIHPEKINKTTFFFGLFSGIIECINESLNLGMDECIRLTKRAFRFDEALND